MRFRALSVLLLGDLIMAHVVRDQRALQGHGNLLAQCHGSETGGKWFVGELTANVDIECHGRLIKIQTVVDREDSVSAAARRVARDRAVGNRIDGIVQKHDAARVGVGIVGGNGRVEAQGPTAGLTARPDDIATVCNVVADRAAIGRERAIRKRAAAITKTRTCIRRIKSHLAVAQLQIFLRENAAALGFVG